MSPHSLAVLTLFVGTELVNFCSPLCFDGTVNIFLISFYGLTIPSLSSYSLIILFWSPVKWSLPFFGCVFFKEWVLFSSFTHWFHPFPLLISFLPSLFLCMLWYFYIFPLLLHLFMWTDILFARLQCWLIFHPFFHTVVETYSVSLGGYILKISFIVSSISL